MASTTLLSLSDLFYALSPPSSSIYRFVVRRRRRRVAVHVQWRAHLPACAVDGAIILALSCPIWDCGSLFSAFTATSSTKATMPKQRQSDGRPTMPAAWRSFRQCEWLVVDGIGGQNFNDRIVPRLVGVHLLAPVVDVLPPVATRHRACPHASRRRCATC